MFDRIIITIPFLGWTVYYISLIGDLHKMQEMLRHPLVSLIRWLTYQSCLTLLLPLLYLLHNPQLRLVVLACARRTSASRAGSSSQNEQSVSVIATGKFKITFIRRRGSVFWINQTETSAAGAFHPIHHDIVKIIRKSNNILWKWVERICNEITFSFLPQKWPGYNLSWRLLGFVDCPNKFSRKKPAEFDAFNPVPKLEGGSWK